MKKSFLAFFSMMSVVSPLWAAEQFDDADVFRNVFESLNEKYIEEVSLGDFIPEMLKGLHKADKNLRVGNDGKRVTLYYKAKPYRSFLKPEDSRDVSAGIKLTERVFDAAKKVSAKARAKEFELADIVLQEGVEKFLDGDSKYYPEFSAEEKGLLKNKRQFSAKMIDGALYVRIGAFNKYTEKSLAQAVEENPQFDGVILDLRGSPGGLFVEAAKVADFFLDEGIIASSQDRNGKITYYNSFAGDKINGKPLVILVDGETASSAEIIAAGLQEQGRAAVIGTKTYGKGTMQEIISLPNGAELALTTAYFYTPSERKLDKNGLFPDICTTNIESREDMSTFLSKPSISPCESEAREGGNFDIEAAAALIKQKL